MLRRSDEPEVSEPDGFSAPLAAFYDATHDYGAVCGGVVARDEFVLSHRPAQQVELLARQSPFREWTVSGGFDGQPPDDGVDVQVWELVK